MRPSGRVLYFSGCYAGYIRPEIGLAALRVLRRLGFMVLVPDQHCCGLPMMAKGLIGSARGKLKANRKKWQSLLSQVDHVVVTCSSCGLMLQKEWADLSDNPFVENVQAKLIHISRLVNRGLHRLDLAPQPLRAAYHMPCHLKLQPQARSSITLLERIPAVAVETLDSHCCGMAGSWGMRADTYHLSACIGGDLMDKLAESDADLALTDCPTCRMQMEDLGTMTVCHPIEVVAAALR
jgi:Fe-S oxidoreductase